eukprot:6110498-Ditylum_brightwellii.AAC.1
MKNCKPAVAPTSGPKPLGPDLHGKDVQLQDRWNYAPVVGMMMYMISSSRPEITFAVHQCARYLKRTRFNDLIIKPNMKEVLQLQIKVALSTIHAEYVTLSQSLRDLLPTKELITEVIKGMWQKDKHKEFKFVSKFTVYENNNGVIRVASCPKLTPI